MEGPKKSAFQDSVVSIQAACLSGPTPSSIDHSTASSGVRGNSGAPGAAPHLKSLSSTYSVKAQESDIDLCFLAAVFCLLSTQCPSELLDQARWAREASYSRATRSVYPCPQLPVIQTQIAWNWGQSPLDQCAVATSLRYKGHSAGLSKHNNLGWLCPFCRKERHFVTEWPSGCSLWCWIWPSETLLKQQGEGSREGNRAEGAARRANPPKGGWDSVQAGASLCPGVELSCRRRRDRSMDHNLACLRPSSNLSLTLDPSEPSDEASLSHWSSGNSSPNLQSPPLFSYLLTFSIHCKINSSHVPCS